MVPGTPSKPVGCKPCGGIPAPAKMVWPAWMDAPYATRASDVQVQEFILTGGATETLVPGDPLRWAIGFFIAGVGAMANGPRPSDFPEGYFFPPPSADAPNWYTIFTYGPIVTAPWLLPKSTTARILVVGIRLQ